MPELKWRSFVIIAQNEILDVCFRAEPDKRYSHARAQEELPPHRREPALAWEARKHSANPEHLCAEILTAQNIVLACVTWSPRSTNHRTRLATMTFPRLVVSVSPQAVLRAAMKLFIEQTGTACDLPVFTDSLWRLGFHADQRGPNWILALPTKPHSSDSHYRRLRHITR